VERPHLTLVKRGRLIEAVPDRYRLLILVTAIASLRFGEVTALERQDIDLGACTIRVRQQYIEVKGRGVVLSPPKSRAGFRTFGGPA
jgi:integrase